MLYPINNGQPLISFNTWNLYQLFCWCHSKNHLKTATHYPHHLNLSSILQWIFSLFRGEGGAAENGSMGFEYDF